MNNSIPRWVTVVSVLIALLGSFVGGSLYYSPGTFLKNVDLSSEGALMLTRMWAARQLAIALIILYSAFKRSAPMLKISLVAYCLMTFQDIFIGVSRKDAGVIIGSSVACILSASMIYALRDRRGEVS